MRHGKHLAQTGTECQDMRGANEKGVPTWSQKVPVSSTGSGKWNWGQQGTEKTDKDGRKAFKGNGAQRVAPRIGPRGWQGAERGEKSAAVWNMPSVCRGG